MLYIWKQIEQKFPDWRLLVVGEGDYRFSFESQAKHLGLMNISFEGNQNPESYYKRASIICLTSSCEGFGMVLIEAMQYGCVPVAYNSYAAFSDIVTDGKNGFAVVPFKKDEFVRKLSILMSDADLCAEMAKKAMLVPAKFDSQTIVPMWVNLFDSIA